MLALLLVSLALAWMCAWHLASQCPLSQGEALCQSICAGGTPAATYLVIWELLFILPIMFYLIPVISNTAVSHHRERGILVSSPRPFRPPKLA